MITFKVVRQNEKNEEVFSSIINSDFSLQYQIGKTTTPKIGKIYVFKSLQNLEDWIKNTELLEQINKGKFAVLKGKAHGVSKPKRTANVIVLNHQEAYLQSSVHYWNTVDIEEFWKNKQKHKRTLAHQPPINSYTCSSFTPMEIIT